MEKITSRSNPLLVRMKKLAASASYRRQQGVYLCDSPKLLAEALKWHAIHPAKATTLCVKAPSLIAWHRLWCASTSKWQNPNM